MSITLDFDKAVKNIMDNYKIAIDDTVKEAVKEVAKEATAKLKQTSPKKTGNYAKGWAYKVETSRVSNNAIVYGKKSTYPLAHLLEYGHAKRNGGRTPAIPHIQPVEEWAAAELVKRITEGIKK